MLLVGLVLSIFVFSWLEHEDNFSLATSLLFLSLTFLHISANYLAVPSVVLESLNPTRYSQVIQKFTSDPRHCVLTPTHISKEEWFLSLFSITSTLPMGVRFSAPLDVLWSWGEDERERAKVLRELTHQSRGERYIIRWKEREWQCIVVVHTHATPKDRMKAYFYMWLLASQHTTTHCDDDISLQVSHLFPLLFQGMEEEGWDVGNGALLCGEGWSASWGNTHTEIKNKSE